MSSTYNSFVRLEVSCVFLSSFPYVSFKFRQESSVVRFGFQACFRLVVFFAGFESVAGSIFGKLPVWYVLLIFAAVPRTVGVVRTVVGYSQGIKYTRGGENRFFRLFFFRFLHLSRIIILFEYRL